MGTSATLHGGDLFKQGFSIGQVVHAYGELCQATTELAVELAFPFATEDFLTLNRCLDNAIASAVTEYARQRDVDLSKAEVRRHGLFAHELRNYLHSAMLSFQAVKSGRVGVTGSTFAVLERSLRGLRELTDRSVAEVRLASGMHHRTRIQLAAFIEDIEVNALLEANDRGVRFKVERVDDALRLDVDRHLFTAAISNLLQNAFKFTKASSNVTLRSRSEGDRIVIEVEDGCGGLSPRAVETLLRPLDQEGRDREGMGLGLAIARNAIEADGGTLSVRDIPGKGCVFSVEMPLAVDNAVGAARTPAEEHPTS
jgi:signal transduction histidine kinase